MKFRRKGCVSHVPQLEWTCAWTIPAGEVPECLALDPLSSSTQSVVSDRYLSCFGSWHGLQRLL